MAVDYSQGNWQSPAGGGSPYMSGGGYGGSSGGGGSWFSKLQSNPYASAIFGGIGAALTTDTKDKSNAALRMEALRGAEYGEEVKDIEEVGDLKRATGGDAPSFTELEVEKRAIDLAAEHEKNMIKSKSPITPEIQLTLDLIDQQNKHRNQVAMRMQSTQPPTAIMSPERQQQLARSWWGNASA